MKNILKVVMVSLLIAPFAVSAQDAKPAQVKISKSENPGLLAESKYSRTLVEQAIAGKLNEAGIKKIKKKNKFYTVKGVTVPEISAGKIDLYYKIQKKRGRSVIYFVVSKGYNNYVTAETDPVTNGNTITFIGKIDALVAHNKEIAAKQDEVKKTNERLAKEQNDVKKAEDKKAAKDKELQDLKNKN